MSHPCLSLVVAVLDSHEVVRRQLLYLDRVVPTSCELVLVDDGSEPPIRDVIENIATRFPLSVLETRDRRPWTQPRARNLGAAAAQADWLLFFDIDHIISPSVIAESLEFADDKMHWLRRPAVLDEAGNLVLDHETLVAYGLRGRPNPSVHQNSFLLKRGLFERLGGYSEAFCGSYGGDDVDFNRRYSDLVRDGLARPAVVRGEGYVFPDPAGDLLGLFHGLERSGAG